MQLVPSEQQVARDPEICHRAIGWRNGYAYPRQESGPGKLVDSGTPGSGKPILPDLSRTGSAQLGVEWIFQTMYAAGVTCIDCHMAPYIVGVAGNTTGTPVGLTERFHDWKVAENLPYSCGAQGSLSGFTCHSNFSADSARAFIPLMTVQHSDWWSLPPFSTEVAAVSAHELKATSDQLVLWREIQAVYGRASRKKTSYRETSYEEGARSEDRGRNAMMTGASKRSKRNRAPAMWSLSLLFFGLLAMLPAAGEQAASSDQERGMLIAGGLDQFNGPMATAEFYNFKTQNFSCKFLGGVNSATGACNSTLAQARFYASVAPLPGGGVLIAGGNGIGVICLNSAEIYDSSTGKFTATGSMTDAHCFAHTTTVLQNGEVLITGGEDETGNLVNTADMYNPATGKFDCSTLGGADPTTGYCLSTLTDTRFLDTATLLKDGRVLIAGGNDGSIVNTAELFDPVAGTFGCSSLGGSNALTGFCNNTMTDSRENHTATLIVTGPNAGDVLIAGGLDAAGNVLQTAELYSPTAGNFTATGNMTHARYLHTATQLMPLMSEVAMPGTS